jgi:excisionase family DNA binding protein
MYSKKEVIRMESEKTIIQEMSIFNEYGDIVSVDDVMKMLHIGRTAVYTLLQNGSIRSVKVGRKYIIPKQSVIDFVK